MFMQAMLVLLIIMAILAIRARKDTLAILGMGVGALFNATFLILVVWRWTPAKDLSSLSIAIAGFVALILLCLGFFIQGILSLRRQKFGATSSS